MKTAIDCTTLWSTALLLVLMGRDGWVVKVEKEGAGEKQGERVAPDLGEVRKETFRENGE